ncbi:TIGR00730 family Rossman fold protein [Campylobacter lanienae]|uniref:LOG family protein n=1 Tax=Campylobacter lanienae TaxID=75658 RepID=UPI000BB416B7|nr:TIGR00730 family Rossman fold protein [Campylobacter lanienae]
MKYVTIFGSSRLDDTNIHYKKAYEIAAALAKAGYGVITGGAGGIMEAANRGAFEAGGESIGYNVVLPNEQHPNSYCNALVTMDNLRDRKHALIKDSSAFIILPGGFGTLDEVFEVMTLAQTKIKEHKVVFVQSEFWALLFEFFKRLEDDGMIDYNSEFYRLIDDVDEILEFIKS